MLDYKDFVDKLALAASEDKQVNPLYIDYITRGLKKYNIFMDSENADFTFHTDGCFNCMRGEAKTNLGFQLFIECKLNVPFHTFSGFSTTLIQVLFYLKQFELSGKRIPDIVVMGSKRNCVVLDGKDLYDRFVKSVKYPISDRGVKISASNAGRHPSYQFLKDKIDESGIFNGLNIIDSTQPGCIQQLCEDILDTTQKICISKVSIESLKGELNTFHEMLLSATNKPKNLFDDIMTSENSSIDIIMSYNVLFSILQNLDKPEGIFTDVIDGELCGLYNYNGIYVKIPLSDWQDFVHGISVLGYNEAYLQNLSEVKDDVIDFVRNKQTCRDLNKYSDINYNECFKIAVSCYNSCGSSLRKLYEFSEPNDPELKHNVIPWNLNPEFLTIIKDCKSLIQRPLSGTKLAKTKLIMDNLNIPRFNSLCKIASQYGLINSEDVSIFSYAMQAICADLGIFSNELLHSVLMSDNAKDIVFLINQNSLQDNFDAVEEFCSDIGKLFNKRYWIFEGTKLVKIGGM